MLKIFVFTRFKDGGVSLRSPSSRCIGVMSTGGRWADMPRGFVDTQIERQIAGGRDPDGSARFARALAFGGLTTAQAMAVLRVRECKHLGRDIESFSRDELPDDRWFRDAWTRNHNGAIRIDLKRAQPIQWEHIRRAVADENKRRRDSFDPMPLIKPLWRTLNSACRYARDEYELRKIWPEGLPC